MSIDVNNESIEACRQNNNMAMRLVCVVSPELSRHAAAHDSYRMQINKQLWPRPPSYPFPYSSQVYEICDIYLYSYGGTWAGVIGSRDPATIDKVDGSSS